MPHGILLLKLCIDTCFEAECGRVIWEISSSFREKGILIVEFCKNVSHFRIKKISVVQGLNTAVRSSEDDECVIQLH